MDAPWRQQRSQQPQRDSPAPPDVYHLGVSLLCQLQPPSQPTPSLPLPRDIHHKHLPGLTPSRFYPPSHMSPAISILCPCESRRSLTRHLSFLTSLRPQPCVTLPHTLFTSYWAQCVTRNTSSYPLRTWHCPPRLLTHGS